MVKELQKNSIRLSSIDLLGDQFSFKFSTPSGKFQTSIGGCLTLAIALLILITSPVIFSQYLDTNSPIVTTSSVIGQKNSTHNLYKAQMLPPLIFSENGMVDITELDRYFTIKGYSTELRFNNHTLKYDYISVREFGYSICQHQNDLLFEELVNITATTAIDSRGKFWCPDFKGDFSLAEVSKENTETSFKRFVVKLYPCSLEDKSRCKTLDLIAQSGGFVWSFISRPITPENYTNPIRLLPLLEIYEIDLFTTQHKYFTSKNNRLVDNRNELSGAVMKKEFVTLSKSGEDTMSRDSSIIHCQRNDIKFGGSCPEFYSFEISGGEEETIIRRDYKRLGEMLGELGGLLKVLTGLVLLYTFYNLKIRAKYFTQSIQEQKNKITQKKSNRDYVKHQIRRGQSSPSGRASQTPKDLSPAGIVNDPEGFFGPPNQNKTNHPGSSRTPAYELFKSRIGSEKFVKGINLVDVLEDLMTQNSDRILIPIALTRMKQNKVINPVVKQRRGAKQGDQQLPGTSQNYGYNSKLEVVNGGMLGGLLSIFLKKELESETLYLSEEDTPKKKIALGIGRGFNTPEIGKGRKSSSSKFLKKPKIIMGRSLNSNPKRKSKLSKFIQAENDKGNQIKESEPQSAKDNKSVKLKLAEDKESRLKHGSKKGVKRQRFGSIDLESRQRSSRQSEASKESSGSERMILRRSDFESKRFSQFKSRKKN